MIRAVMVHRQTVLTVGIALGSGIVFGSVTAIGGIGQLPGPANTAKAAGLFTEAQATSGEAVYRQSCASCHGVELRGGPAPPLVGPAFEASWGDPRVTLDDLFFVIRTTMPPRASGSLSPQDHTAAFAYILKVNGYAPGLPAQAVSSERLKLEHLQGAAPRPPARAASPPFIAGAAGATAANRDPIRPRWRRRHDRPTGCFTVTTTPARAFHRSTRSTSPTPDAWRQCACSRWASETTFKPIHSCTTARCT
jgi:mono/diheme cytochrome c family protein